MELPHSELYHPVKVGNITLKGNIFLAPVAGWTTRSFRSLCVEEGAAFCWTELISSEALVRDCRKSQELLSRAPNEIQYGIQLFGANPLVMARAAEIILKYKPAIIDVNAGCPVPKVTKSGAGAALMREPGKITQIVAALVSASGGETPVSIKMRSGWDAANINFLECAERAVEAGAAMVGLHPRTKTQGYGGKSNRSFIKELAAKVNVPVTGSGDLYSAADAREMLAETGCAAVMFARGAMGNPFIFRQTLAALGAIPPAASCDDAVRDYEKRLRTAFRHLYALAQDIGEERACREMRKIFPSYIKNFAGASALRNKITRCESIKEYEEAAGVGEEIRYKK